jgi:lipopolysaccharide/colanic/teichoic acid biosynthesis glycosyltransferase
MFYKPIKRFFDFIFSAVLIVVLLPILIPIMIGLKLTGEGEIFYFQKRVGLNLQFFDIWKFATMLKNSPSIGTGTITLRDDPRVLPMGKFLRKTKINELPQIVNVLNGSMSFVGPRPLVKKDADRYTDEQKQLIYSSKPGITGIGSVIFRDEEAWVSASEMDPHEFYLKHITPYKAAVELWYRENKGFKTDFLILFLTGWAIIFPKNDLARRFFPNIPPKPVELS